MKNPYLGLRVYQEDIDCFERLRQSTGLTSAELFARLLRVRVRDVLIEVADACDVRAGQLRKQAANTNSAGQLMDLAAAPSREGGA